MGCGLLELLVGRPLPQLLVLGGQLIIDGRPREQGLLFVVGPFHLRRSVDRLVTLTDFSLVAGGAAERLVDGLERGGVVPVALVLIVLEGRGRRLELIVGRSRDGDHGFGFVANGDVLLLRRAAAGDWGSFLRLVPLDVLDRGEELVQILEQVVALALVVGH
jgi:hypothetical protein